ncbi:MAG TPA: SMC family ATPase, partial [Candidatus Deferrimicrobium sp.]|nr:SMC family ATPase [Candidatus Deferrimicrobium sp.]
MRLTAIEVQNFRVLKNVRISFPDNVIGVIGPNGAGKSTLVEAISWALYGSPVARSGKDEIKSALAGPNEPCQVSLEFSVRAENYRVIRRLAGRLERPEVELYRSDASESVGVIETQRYVDELLGLDWQGFRTSFVARQQELNALSDLQPAKRRDQLAGMLGIERLDRAMQLLKEDTRSLERQADFLQRQLADIASVDQRIAQLREQIAVTTERARQAEQACRMAKSDFDIATSTMQQWQQTKSAWLKFQAQIDAGQKTKTLLSDQVRRLSEEQSRLTALESQLITLEKNLVQMPEIKRQFEMLKLAKSRLEARQSLLRQQSDLLSESIQTEIRLKEIERSLAEYSAQLSEIPDNVSDRLHELQILLDQARHDFGSLQGEKIALSKEIDTLDEQMQSIARFGPESVCDRCLRPLGDSLPQIKAHLHEERLKLQSSLGEIDERLRTKEEEGKKLKTDGDELQRLVQLHNTLT